MRVSDGGAGEESRGAAPARVPPRTRVLVVDDEPTICLALRIAFTRAGFEARAAQSGESAEQLLRAERFDAMVVDLYMPDHRGDVLFEVAAALQPALRRRTVMTTGDLSEYAQRIVAACGCPLLLKPFDLDDLIGIVRQLTHEARGASA
jgi:DNA-binding NtrC family response regulator